MTMRRDTLCMPDTIFGLTMQVANALSPTATYAAGQRWFTLDQAAKEHARALQHPETDFDPETGAVELHSALSSLNEATFETAQVRYPHPSEHFLACPK